MVRSRFQVPHTEIGDGLELKFEEIKAVELGIERPANLKFISIGAEVKLAKSTMGVHARFEVLFTVEMECVRCLGKLRRDFDEILNLEYVQGIDPFARTDKVELKAGEMDRVYFKGFFLDMSMGIKEAIVFALPVAPTCRDDCRGLCTICGKNLNEGACGCPEVKEGSFTVMDG